MTQLSLHSNKKMTAHKYASATTNSLTTNNYYLCICIALAKKLRNPFFYSPPHSPTVVESTVHTMVNTRGKLNHIQHQTKATGAARLAEGAIR